MKHLTLLLFMLSSLLAMLSCTSPTESEKRSATIRLNVLYPGQSKSDGAALNRAIDRVTVSVFGFRGAQGTQEFSIIEEQELTINTNENVAEGQVVVPLGDGLEVTGQIDGQTVTGENIRISVEMFEGGSVVFTGDSGIFFVAPGVSIESPAISLSTVITDPDGATIGTVSVTPNPLVAFGTFTMEVTISDEFVNQVTSVSVTFLIPNGNTLALTNSGGGLFSLNILGNFIGNISFEFVARDANNIEVGRGTNFIRTIVDSDATGFGRDIRLEGDFEIAVGFSLQNTTIVWTQAESEGEIGANLLRVEDITSGGELIWEIQSADGAGPFTPVIIYGRIFSGVSQIFPENNAFPAAFVDGRRYRITIEGVQAGQPRSAFTEFTFASSGPSAPSVKNVSLASE